MAICCVVGCHNQSKKPGVTFHRFPAAQHIRDRWIKAVRRKNWTPNKWSRVCSTHFEEKDIDRTSLSCVRLRENVVPVLFPSYAEQQQQKVRKSRKPRIRNVAATALVTPVAEALVSSVTAAAAAAKATVSPVEEAPVLSIGTLASQAAATIDMTTEAVTPHEVTPVYVQVNVQPPPPTNIVYCEPAKLKLKLEKARKKLDCARKQIKVLKQSVRRLKKSNALLTVQISELKEMRANDDNVVISNHVLKLLKAFRKDVSCS